MSRHDNSHDSLKKVVVDPHLRAWFDPRRAWHLQTVRLQAESRWIADGSQVGVEICLAGPAGEPGTVLQSVQARISKDRLVGADGKNGVEHVLDWKLPAGAAGATGLVARVQVPDYRIAVVSALLELDLLPYAISG